MMKMTREFERNLPAFKSQAKAEAYFKEIYSDSMKLVGIEEIDSQDCYFYDVIYNHDLYNKFMENVAKNSGYQVSTEEMFSYQRVEIFEDGNVHIVF